MTFCQSKKSAPALNFFLTRADYLCDTVTTPDDVGSDGERKRATMDTIKRIKYHADLGLFDGFADANLIDQVASIRAFADLLHSKLTRVYTGADIDVTVDTRTSGGGCVSVDLDEGADVFAETDTKDEVRQIAGDLFEDSTEWLEAAYCDVCCENARGIERFCWPCARELGVA